MAITSRDVLEATIRDLSRHMEELDKVEDGLVKSRNVAHDVDQIVKRVQAVQGVVHTLEVKTKGLIREYDESVAITTNLSEFLLMLSEALGIILRDTPDVRIRDKMDRMVDNLKRWQHRDPPRKDNLLRVPDVLSLVSWLSR